MNRKTNLRNLRVAPGSGKEVEDTKMLKGTGKMSAAQNDTNELTQYETGSAPDHGKLGGKPSGT